MRNILFLLLLNCTLADAQNTLDGTVYLYKENGTNTPLENVYIKADGGGTGMTKKDGYYSLAFDNSFTIVHLFATRQGFEVINAPDLNALDLSKKKQQQIYMDVEGNTKKRAAELETVYDKKAKARRDVYFMRLDKGGAEAAKAKKELEVQAKKTFKDIDEAKAYIAEQYVSNTGMLAKLIPIVMYQNLDHSNKEVTRIKRLMLEGKTDSLRMIIDAIDYRKDSIEAMQRRTQRTMLNETDKNEKEKTLALIPQMLLDGNYDKVDQAYNYAILLDTTDLNSYFNYAYFLRQQNNFNKAINLYTRVLSNTKLENEYSRSATLNNLGALYKDIQQFSNAEKAYNEALQIRRKLAAKNPDAYEPNVAETLNNLGALYDAIQHFSDAEKAYNEALQLYRRLAAKNPDAYESYVATALTNLGTLYDDIQHFSNAEKAYNEALQIERALAAKNSDAYEPDVAETLMNLGILYKDSQQFSNAEKAYNEALQLYRRFAAKNPDAYESYVAKTLNNLGVLYDAIQQFPDAEKAYNEALQIERRLAAKNSDAYELGVAVTLNNLGILYVTIQQFSNAEKAYNEALQIERKLAAKNSDAYKSYVARTLNNLGNLYYNIQQFSDAEKAYNEALQLYRRLADKNPSIYLNNVLKLLNEIGLTNFHLQNTQASLNYYKEAYALSKVMNASGKGNAPELKKALSGISKVYKSLKQYDSLYHYALQLVLLTKSNLAVDSSGSAYYNLMSAVRDLAEAFNAQCKKDSSFKYYQLTLQYTDTTISKFKLLLSSKSNPDLLSAYASLNGNASWYALHAKRYALAEQYAKACLSADTSSHWVETNLAHALLFQNKYNEAVKIYLSLKARPYSDSTKTYPQVLLEDFEALACSGAIPAERAEDVEKIKAILKKEY